MILTGKKALASKLADPKVKIHKYKGVVKGADTKDEIFSGAIEDIDIVMARKILNYSADLLWCKIDPVKRCEHGNPTEENCSTCAFEIKIAKGERLSKFH